MKHDYNALALIRDQNSLALYKAFCVGYTPYAKNAGEGEFQSWPIKKLNATKNFSASAIVENSG